MKKILVFAVAAIVGVALASGALAQMGPGMGQGKGPGMMGPGHAAMTPEGQKFMADTAKEREAVCARQQELATLMQDPNADAAKVGTLVKEIHKMRADLYEKSRTAGMGGRMMLQCPGGPGMGMWCDGTGPKGGKGMRGGKGRGMMMQQPPAPPAPPADTQKKTQ